MTEKMKVRIQAAIALIVISQTMLVALAFGYWLRGVVG